MSKRRNIGDIVRKKAHAGFVGEELTIKLLDLEEDWKIKHPYQKPYEDCCHYDWMCQDKDCREWTTCEIIVDGKPTGNCCYHVNECQMEDIE